MLFISILSVTHWLVLCFLSSSLTLSWISRVFCTCSALFNFQDTVLDITFCWSHFRAATFILYHTFELLSSELFVNVFNISWSSARFCSLCYIFEILTSPLQLLYYITSRFICQVNKLWTEISFCSFQSILCSTSQRNAYNLFFRSLTFQASVKFCSPSASLHPAPCIGVPQLSASGLHTLSCSLTPPFLVRQLYYYIIPFSVCQADISTKFTAFFG